MKKFYAFALLAAAALSASAQDGAPLYATGSSDSFPAAWDPANCAEFVWADGVYTLTADNLVKMKISTAQGDWDTFNGSALQLAGVSVSKDNMGQALPLEAGDGDIEIPWTGDYKVVVAADLSTIIFTTDTPEPTGPAEIYLRGDAVGSWDAQPDWMFTQVEGNKYVFNLKAADKVIPAGLDFKIADANWGTINYGSDGEVCELDVPYEWVYNASNATLAEECTGYVEIELPEEAKGALSVTFSNDDYAGVQGVVVENAAAVYYNLQGVRVANAENGLYIVKQGNKVSKVYVK